MIFDRAHFEHMTAGDRTLQREVLGLFAQQAPTWASACADGERWRDAVHTIKGAARGIGFTRLAQACAAAEQALHEQARAPLLVDVGVALDEALDEVRAFSAGASRSA